MNKIYFGENLNALKIVESESVDLIYIDPPFNTGKTQSLVSMSDVRSSKTVKSSMEYSDSFDDYDQFLLDRIHELFRILKSGGSFYLHIDYRESHYVKIMLDTVFGRRNFINEIVWAYDYGAKPKTRWPAKHDNIFYYSKGPAKTFNVDDIEREPYMAPGLVTKEKADRGKLPTDVWWHTIVPTNGKERTGYPTQKPEGILKRIITASSNPGDLVLDCFAGSGTTGKVAYDLGRFYILVDSNPQSIDVMLKRFSYQNPNPELIVI